MGDGSRPGASRGRLLWTAAILIIVLVTGAGAWIRHEGWGSASSGPVDQAVPRPTESPEAKSRIDRSAITRSSNCAPVPSKCGFPDGTNTGVPAGVTLKSVPGQVNKGAGWHYDGRESIVVDGDGAVLEGLQVPFTIDVQASGVTIRNCRVVARGEGFGVSLRHTRDVTIEDSEIYSPDAGAGRLLVGIKDIFGDATGTKVLRSEIWHTSTGVQIYQGLIQDNYIHDPGFKAGDHLNGTTSNGGVSGQLTIRHNTILNRFGQTDAISLFEDFGEEKNRTIDHNLVAGGGYTIYGGANAGGPPTSNIKITNNRFSRLYFDNGGGYGPIAAFNRHGVGNVWSANVWDDTEDTITSDGETK